MNSFKRVALCILILTLIPSVASSDDTAPSRRVLVGFVVSPFLPVVTLNLPVHFALSPWLSWGGSLNAFYVLGKSINGELFIEPVYHDGKWLRLSSRLGLIVGWNEEISFGRTLDRFWGLGGHLVLLEGIVKMEPFFVRLCMGTQVLTDLAHAAGSVYAGIGAGITIHVD